MFVFRLITNQKLQPSRIWSQPDQQSTGRKYSDSVSNEYWSGIYLFRIADEMKTEGNFSAEKESNAMVDFKPQRPKINRWVRKLKSFTLNIVISESRTPCAFRLLSCHDSQKKLNKRNATTTNNMHYSFKIAMQCGVL